MDRRRFVRDSAGALVATVIVGCGGGSESGADPPTGPGGPSGPPAMTPGVTVAGNVITVNLTIQTSLTDTNGFLLIPEARTFVFHLGNNNYRAFTSVCTHEMCDVNAWSGGRIRCPCHGSQYDQSGQVVVGPATAPLRQFTTNVSGTTLRITTT